MSEQTAEPIAQPEPIGGDTETLRRVATQLEDRREDERATSAPTDVSAKFPNPSDADIEQLRSERNAILKDRVQAKSEERIKEGRSSPIDARTAAQLLADLRQDVGQAFDNEMQGQAAEVQVDQVVAEAAQQEQPQRPGDSPEVAAVKQALSSEWQATNQAATQYRAGLQALGQMILAEAGQQFADIKTQADLQVLAQTNPARYLQFEQTRQKLGAVAAQIQNAEQSQKQQLQAQFNTYATEQDDKFMEMHPQFADEAKRTEAGRNTVAALKSAGLSEAEIQHAWNNHIFLRDARVQTLLLELGNYYAAKQAARRVTAVPKPPVQRPGVSMPTGGVDPSGIGRADRQFSDKPSVKNAAALLIAHRGARR
jgi:hypothetical protein